MLHNLSVTSLLIFIFGTTTTFSLAQKVQSVNISDCFGAVDLPSKGVFKITFTQLAGVYDDVYEYKSMLSFKESNSIWMHFQAPYDGSFQLSIANDKFEIEALLFQGQEITCEDILSGGATPVQYIAPNESLAKIDTVVLKKGEHFYIYFNSTQKQLNQLLVNTSFTQKSIENSINQLQTEVDRRTDIEQPYLRIGIRDKDSKLPVNARIIVSASKSYDAMYQGTDLLLPNDRNLKFNLKIDAVGYFFSDQEIKTSGNETEELIIELDPIEAGKQLELQGIHFLPQSSDFAEEAEINLKRIRDFLALNSDLKIEVQGHVYRLGKNNFYSKRLSKKRAKKVMKYLLRSGINKSRLTAVGFGNLHMKYPEPKSKSEEQANRRVEIKIL